MKNARKGTPDLFTINKSFSRITIHIGNYPMATKLFTQALETAKNH